MLCLFEKYHNITHDGQNVYIDKRKVFTSGTIGGVIQSFLWNYKRRVWIRLPEQYTPTEYAKTLKKTKNNFIIEILTSTYSKEYKSSDLTAKW